MLKKREEIANYVLISSDDVDLPVDICVDNYQHHELANTAHLLYLRNGYNSENEWIGITVEKYPEITPIHCSLNISYADLESVYQFVQQNLMELEMVDKGVLNLLEFIDKIRYKTLAEDISLIQEMSVLSTSYTGLPRDIWVDEGSTFQKGGHWLRIKVKSPKQEKDSHNWLTLKLPSLEWVGENDLTQNEKELLKRYAKLNIEELTKLTLGQIDLKTYLQKSYKIDAKGNVVNSPQEEWKKYKNLNFGITALKHNLNPNQYTFVKTFGDDNDYIFKYEDGSPIVFDNISNFNQQGNAWLQINGDLFLGNKDGRLKKIKAEF